MIMHNKFFTLEQRPTGTSIRKSGVFGPGYISFTPEEFTEFLRFLGPLTEAIDFTKIEPPK